MLAVVALFVKGAPHGTLTRGGISFSGFVATIAVAVLWQIAYAPYVSDYSRYLPKETPPLARRSGPPTGDACSARPAR